MTGLWLIPVVLVALGVALALRGWRAERAQRAALRHCRSELIAAVNDRIQLATELEAMDRLYVRVRDGARRANRRSRLALDAAHAEIEAVRRNGPEHEPCPCCGARLSVEYGDDPGEIAVVGERSP